MDAECNSGDEKHLKDADSKLPWQCRKWWKLFMIPNLLVRANVFACARARMTDKVLDLQGMEAEVA